MRLTFETEDETEYFEMKAEVLDALRIELAASFERTVEGILYEVFDALDAAGIIGGATARRRTTEGLPSSTAAPSR